MAIIAVVVAGGCGLIAGLLAPAVLGRLVEPQQGAEGKVAYRQLATARTGVQVGACVLVAVLAALLSQPTATWPVWMVFGTVGVFLAVVDAHTTWIPPGPIYLGWVLLGIAALTGVLLLGADWGDVLRAGLGAGVVWLFFFIIWVVTKGVGFSDVRFAFLIGATAGMTSWLQVAAGVAAGVLLGAVYACIRLARRRHGSFPYAPALAAGAVLATLLP